MNLPAEASPSSLEVSAQVREFYERYPYPRPLDNLDDYGKNWQNLQRRRADFHLFWPDCPYRENYTILIAGCGTSQAAKHAIRRREAQVTGIDCSATSVRHTEQLKEKYGLENLQVHQLAIEQVSNLGITFDQIVCTGVLHHLADPDVGLRALASVLNPGGVIYLMVYAPYGRVGIYMLQEFCRRLGIRPSKGEIKDLISALSALPQGHPLQILLREAPDFRNEAALADALLNPMDRAYNVSELFRLIEDAGLRFGRWIKQAPYSVQCGIIANLPQATQIASLPLEEQYAAIELFRGTMIRHSVVAYHDRCEIQPIRFDGDEWFNYVPIRMPDTICVEERLPAGSAGVLINRGHTYTDLFLPISAVEKEIVESIDGQRSIGEIARDRTSVDAARSLFERLWWHDQVVFETATRP